MRTLVTAWSASVVFLSRALQLFIANAVHEEDSERDRAAKLSVADRYIPVDVY